MDEEKKFIVPEAEIVDFTNEDIITLSGAIQGGFWGDDDNAEDWRVV